MAPGEPPRALVLQSSDLQLVIGKLARACLSFQEAFLAKPKSPAGLLCQAWMPDLVEDSQIVLKTKNMPFCVAGMGDLLALFRCISCRFAFGTNVTKPATLGAPGRVYASSEPEMCCNVQHYAQGAYLRKAEAEQCQVQSTLLLPLFISPRRTGCVGVLEIVQTSEDMAFVDVAALLSTSLERCDLYTASMDTVRRHAPHAALRSTNVLLPPQMGVLVAPQASSDPQGSGSDRGGGGAGDEGAGGRGESEDFSADEDDEDGESGDEGTRRGGKSAQGRGGSGGGGQRPRRKGTGNPGKPGVRLTMADLQSQFGVGLKEAAARLGICPTTLKRACRRHGIQRWPRRQLQKVNRALDELEARQMMQPQQHLVATPTATADAFGAQADPAHDSRWTTLAQFMPAYHAAAASPAAGVISGMFPSHEQQLQQGLLPYAAPQLHDAAMQQQQQVQQQHILVQQHTTAAQQQQQQHMTLQQQVLAAAAAAVNGQGGGHQAASHASLPDGALAMGGGGHGAGTIIEVSTVSGVSTMGQPPPQSAGPGMQQQGNGAAVPAATTAAGPPQRQQSGASSGGGAPRAAEYLQRVTAHTNYMSPFLPSTSAAGGGSGGAPVVNLPGHMLAAGPNPTTTLSAISVPSLPADVMPSMGLGSLREAHPGMGAAAGMGRPGGGPRASNGTSSNGLMTEDDQIGFLDSSVLELLLSDEQRHGGGLPRLSPLSMPQPGNNTGAAGSAAAPVPSAGMSAGELLMPASAPMPGMSGGMSGLSFMM